jgi:hypothetical protein
MQVPRQLLIAILVVLIGFVALYAYNYYQIHSIVVTRYTIPVKSLPSNFKDFTILHMTDLHSKYFGADQQQLLELINCQQFDLVALTGDFVDKNRLQTKPAIKLVEGLKDKPIYYVSGNHDWRSNFKIKSPLQSLGVHVLDNRGVKIKKNGQHIWLLGVDDPYTGRDDLHKALKIVDDDAIKILLAHAPNIYQPASKEKIDLLLVGHTHGGQIRLPFIGAIVAPGQGLFPKYDYGLYRFGSTQMVINGGLGESSLRIRFNTKPEIALITLQPAD